MKRLIDTDDGAMVALMGERVTLFCANYIYTGLLVGIDDEYVRLEDAAVVYETGPLTSGDWKDAQELPGPWYVMTGAVESFGVLK